MAKPSSALVRLLRETADRLAGGAAYSWSHMGRCNCGHLAQTVTRLDPAEIHRRALARRAGEWREQANDYCGASGVDFEYVLDALFEIGLSPRDVQHLEYLSDPVVLAALPGGFRDLRRNERDDVVLYLRTWADVLAAQVPPARAHASMGKREEAALAVS